MPSNEPTLSDLSNLPVDSALGTGGIANVINTSDTVRNLNEAAKFKAQNDLNRYTTFLGQLQDVYKTGLDTASIDVMPQDREALQDRAASLFQKVGEDPKMVLSGRGSAEVYKELTDLRRDATKSKNDLFFYDTHDKFVGLNPSYNTADTKQKFQQFQSTPLEQRKPFTLDMPAQVDLSALSKDILESSYVKTADSQIVNANKQVDPEGGFIRDYKTIKYKPFIQSWDAALNSSGEYRKYTEGLLKSQPKYIQENYTKKDGTLDIESFWNHLGDSLFQSEIDPDTKQKKDIVTDDKLTANPNYKTNEQLKIEKEKLAIDWAKLGIDKRKADAQIDLWKSKTTGSKGLQNAALNLATTLYNQLEGLGSKNANGQTVITPDAVRKMTSEQLKYLGSFGDTEETNPATGKTTKTKGLKPLSLDDKDVLILDNGKISVLKNASIDQKTGNWVGKLDNSRTTTLTNIATNRVNEENQMSSGKEISDYLPTDLFGSDAPPSEIGGGTTTKEEVKGSSGKVYTLPQ